MQRGPMQKVDTPFPMAVAEIISSAWSRDDALQLGSDVQVAIQQHLDAYFLRATVGVHRRMHFMSGGRVDGAAEEPPSSSWVQAPLTSLAWEDGPGRFAVRLYDDNRHSDDDDDDDDEILIMVGDQYHTLREGAMAVFTLFEGTSIWLKPAHRIVVGSFDAPPYLPKTFDAPPLAITTAFSSSSQEKSWKHVQDITAAYRRAPTNLSPENLVAPDATASFVNSLHLRAIDNAYRPTGGRAHVRALAKTPMKMIADFFTESQCRACIAHFKTHFKIIPKTGKLDFDESHEYQLDTDMPTLISLVGSATVERLRALAPDGAKLGMPFIRRYTPTTRAAIPMHTDKNLFTINVELSSDGAYMGGRLITLGETSDGSRLQFHAHRRLQGTATTHDNMLLHGVEPVTNGERFTYIFFFR